MMKNMGNLDRVVRLIAVVAIVAAFLLGKLSGTLALILGTVAVAFFLTCPICLPFGLSTRRKG